MSASDPASPAERLVCAVLAGDTAEARALLAADRSLARSVEPGLESTPLHMAAHRDQLELVRDLLECGAEVDAREGCSGTTALHWAAEGGHPRIIEALLERGASLQARDVWHALTPLDWAVCVVHAPHRHADREGAARLLESRGAAPSVFTAVGRADVQLLDSVLARDARALERRLGPADGESSALLFAVRSRKAALVSALIERGTAATEDLERGMSAGALAYLGHDDEVLEVLRACGAGKDLSSRIVRRDFEGARAELSRTPGPLRSGGRYAALLHSLALFGLAEEARFALEHGADPEARLVCLGLDEWLAELTPLFLAASSGACEVARVLLELGADVNAQAMRARLTPLHVAAFRNRRGVAQLLLASGAERSARDLRHHATPAEWADHAGHADLARSLA